MLAGRSGGWVSLAHFDVLREFLGVGGPPHVVVRCELPHAGAGGGERRQTWARGATVSGERCAHVQGIDATAPNPLKLMMRLVRSCGSTEGKRRGVDSGAARRTNGELSRPERGLIGDRRGAAL